VNQSANKVHTKAAFLDTDKGPLFTLYRRSTETLPLDHQILIIAPFAEEMNKSRRMFSVLSTALANNGLPSLLVDPYGTGDSPGDFAEATWERWLYDLQAAYQWLQQQGAKHISIVALRAGALLAMDMLNDPNILPKKIILWQPITNGQVMMGQFFRLRLAAGLFGDSEHKESSKDLLRILENEGSLEIAGYELSSSLYHSIHKLRLQNIVARSSASIHWLELISNESQSISMSSRKVIDHLCKSGFSITDNTLIGDPFWSLQEINVVPELIEKTISQLMKS